MDNGAKFFEYVEIFAKEVVDYSSQYGAEGRTAYVAENIVGPPSTYPQYRDSTSSCAFRNYGTRWQSAPSTLSPISGSPEFFSSTDFVDVFFDRPLVVVGIQIYETYCPGTIVALRSCYRDQPADQPVNARGLYWVTLWRTFDLPNNPTQDENVIFPYSSSPRATESYSRLFEPPLACMPLVPTDLIRIEFDIRRSSYYTQIDAVKVKGFSPISPEAAELLQKMNAEGRPPRTQFNRFRNLSLNGNQSSSSQRLLTSPPQMCLPSISPTHFNEVDDHPGQSFSVHSDPRYSDKALIAARSSMLCPLARMLNDSTQLPFITHSTLSIYRTSLFYLSSPLLCLPDDVLLRIFSFLNLQHLCRVSRVCCLFNKLAAHEISRLECINLQAYWPNLNDTHLSYLAKRLRKQTSHTKNEAELNRMLLQEMRESGEAERATSIRYHTWNAHRHTVAEQACLLSGSPTTIKPRTRGISASYISSISRNLESSELVEDVESNRDSEDDSLPNEKLIDAPQHGLRRLDMSWCGNYFFISPSSFNRFLSEVCCNLTTLRLSSCQVINDDCLLHLINTCGLLQELDLSSCRSITSAGFIPLGRLIHLRWLSLYRTRVADQALINLANLCQQLHSINLGSCNCIGDIDSILRHIACNNTNLIAIDLWRSSNLTAAGLLGIGEFCPNLQQLELGWCNGIESQPSNCISTLVSTCRKLRILSLSAIRSICDDDLLAIRDFLQQSIESIDLVGNGLITEAAVETMLSSCKLITFIDLSHCPCISIAAIIKFRMSYPQCTIISTCHSFVSGPPTNARQSIVHGLPQPPSLQSLPAPEDSNLEA